MTNEYEAERNIDQPMTYEIRIRGHLSPQRMKSFEGLDIMFEKEGISRLTGSLPDQAALYGILKKIRDLGMYLLSVNSIDSDQAAAEQEKGNP